MTEDIRRPETTVLLHHLMALCGGLTGVYSIMGRMGVFAAAETTNMIEIVCDILGKENFEFMYRVVALLIYISAMVIYTVMKERSGLEPRYISIGIDALAVISLFFIPLDIDPFVALYPLFFAAAFQWCSFETAKGYSCSTIFSTNNLKQTVTSAAACLTMESSSPARAGMAERFSFYGGTMLCFYGGVGIGYWAFMALGNASVLISLIPLAAAFISLKRS